MKHKVIIFGFPMVVEYENDEEIPTIKGFWAFMLDWLPFNGRMLQYEGSYWRALWHWLFDQPS